MQGCAYPFIRLFTGGPRLRAASHHNDTVLPAIDGAAAAEDVGAVTALPGVSAFAGASPSYSKRWLLADAALAGLCAIIQVFLIGLL